MENMKKAVYLFGCLLLLMTACKKDEAKKFVGTWQPASLSASYNNMPISISSAEQVDYLVQMLKMTMPELGDLDFNGACIFNSTLNIEKKGSFVMNAGCDNPFLSSLEGKYTVQEDTITLSPADEEEDSGESDELRLEGALDEDGRLVFRSEMGGIPLSVAFTKKK